MFLLDRFLFIWFVQSASQSLKSPRSYSSFELLLRNIGDCAKCWWNGELKKIEFSSVSVSFISSLVTPSLMFLLLLSFLCFKKGSSPWWDDVLWKCMFTWLCLGFSKRKCFTTWGEVCIFDTFVFLLPVCFRLPVLKQVNCCLQNLEVLNCLWRKCDFVSSVCWWLLPTFWSCRLCSLIWRVSFSF